MATLNGNSVYISFDGVSVGALWRAVDLKLNRGDEDTTAGSGAEWESHAPKLQSATIKCTFVYDTASFATDIVALYPSDSVVEIIYGPEGNTSGKPKHQQSFKVNSVSGPSQNVDKTLVTIEIDAISTGAPTTNIYAGGTF